VGTLTKTGRGVRGALHLVVALVAASAAVPALAQLTRAPPAGPPAAPLPTLDAGTVLLVVSPHPDDETLCCGGVIQRVLAAGGRVEILWLTSGDAARWNLILIEHALWNVPTKGRALGAQRMAEARAAAALLGVPPAGQLFLGYPDAGLSAVLAAPPQRPYTSPTTGAAAVPYRSALFPDHPYTGASLAEDFATVLRQLQPTLILAPSPADTHPDHRAAGLLTLRISAQRGLSAQVRYWIVHGGEGWPAPRELMPGVPLFPAPRGAGLDSAPFALTPSEEERKHSALNAYASQMQMMAPFLVAFVRSNELFAQRALP
jgi:LmbE family N-acetylglucosaminyl deacetylase